MTNDDTSPASSRPDLTRAPTPTRSTGNFSQAGGAVGGGAVGGGAVGGGAVGGGAVGGGAVGGGAVGGGAVGGGAVGGGAVGGGAVGDGAVGDGAVGDGAVGDGAVGDGAVGDGAVGDGAGGGGAVGDGAGARAPGVGGTVAEGSMASRPLAGWLAVVLVAGTSAAVLVLEILAGRLLAPYVGVSLDTYTGIIGTILAGIAVGAWAGGALADRVDPRRLLPVLLMLGGALAITTIPVVRVIGSGSSAGGGGPMILVLAAFGFLPSATVLSAVPPAVIKLQLRDLEQTGATVGQLSAWGTAGAIFGTFFTGFVLVATAAVSTLIVTTGIVLLASGVALTLFAGSTRAPSPGQATELLGISGLAAMSILGAIAIDSPCATQTSYYCLSVVEEADDPTRKVLVLDDLRHSYVDTDDPTLLSFWYVRRLVDAIDTAPASDDIVYLGGGALTIPRYVRATQPGTSQTVFEIDGELIEVVENQMGLDRAEPEPIDIVIGDARLALADVDDDSTDIVIGDAFGSRSVPFHLATEEFMEEIKRVLRPGGVYAANIIDSGAQRFLSAEAATLARVFDHVVVIRGEAVTQGFRGNSVIVASDTMLDPAAFAERLRAAGDPGDVVTDVEAYIDGVRVLTDDFAPVDQLISATS